MSYSYEVILESIESFKSTIRKTEKSIISMKEKGTNITLISKRLKAFYIGLSILESMINDKSVNYNTDEMKDACEILMSLLPSIKTIYYKSKIGSPQRTLLERRIRAFEIVIEKIKDEIK